MIYILPKIYLNSANNEDHSLYIKKRQGKALDNRFAFNNCADFRVIEQVSYGIFKSKGEWINLFSNVYIEQKQPWKELLKKIRKFQAKNLQKVSTFLFDKRKL